MSQNHDFTIIVDVLFVLLTSMQEWEPIVGKGYANGWKEYVEIL